MKNTTTESQKRNRNQTSDKLRERVVSLIRYEKEKRKWTDNKIAEEMKIKRQVYANMLIGKNILLGNLEKIAEVFDCEIFIDFVPKNKD